MGVQIDLVIFLSSTEKAPLKPNIELVPTCSIGMQSMLQWVESKVPSVMHHVDQNHMDIIPYGWMIWILEKKSKATEKFVASVNFSTVHVSPGTPCGWHVVHVVTYMYY